MDSQRIQYFLTHTDKMALVMILGFWGFGIMGFWLGTSWLRVRHLMKKTPTSTVDSMPFGIVELIGKTATAYSMVSPFTKQTCVYYDMVVEYFQQDPNPNSAVSWIKCYQDQSDKPFYFTDSTGALLVYPQGSKIDSQHKEIEYLNRDSVLEFFADHQDGFKFGSLGHTQFRVTEQIFKPGDDLFVLGTAKVPLESEASRLIPPPAPLKDGVIIAKGGKDQPNFYLTNGNEKTALHNTLIKSLIFIIVGIVFFSFGVFFLVVLWNKQQ